MLDLKNKNATVIGLGKSGLAAVGLLRSIGANVRVSETGPPPDQEPARDILRDIKCEFKGNSREFVEGSDMIVVSPGVNLDSPGLSWVKSSGIPVIGEVELAYMFCKAPIIAVTGTNGKSTVVTLIWKMLSAAGLKAHLLGNIGTPFSEKVLQIAPDDIVVLEISSFQLETIRTFRPRAAVVLNIKQDHIDRHGTMAAYAAAKERIFENQGEGDFAVLNYDDAAVRGLDCPKGVKRYFFSAKEHVEGAYVSGCNVITNIAGKSVPFLRTADFTLPGAHNRENLLAASLIAGIFGDGADMTEAVRMFTGLPHRLKTICVNNGVAYIDDSKSTTVDSTVRALESLSTRVVLIAGGLDKGNDYAPVRELILSKARTIVLIGEAADRIENAFKGAPVPIIRAGSMKDAVTRAAGAAVEGDSVLLSPMCASFDMYSDYKDRGRAFQDAVRGGSCEVA